MGSVQYVSGRYLYSFRRTSAANSERSTDIGVLHAMGHRSDASAP